jgi:hypothetical protein
MGDSHGVRFPLSRMFEEKMANGTLKQVRALRKTAFMHNNA